MPLYIQIKGVDGECKDKAADTFEFDLTSDTQTEGETYYQWELTNVRITSYQINASGNDEAPPAYEDEPDYGTAPAAEPLPTEQISLNYAEVEWTW
jgi:type VI protein secretion system component Hcp